MVAAHGLISFILRGLEVVAPYIVAVLGVSTLGVITLVGLAYYLGILK